MSVARFKVVILFLVAVLAAEVFWNFVLNGFLIHHSDNPAAQGLAAVH